MTHIPELWSILRGEDGTAIVVPEGTSPVDALLSLVEEEFGGERFSPDNPAIVEAAHGLKIEAWHDCSDSQTRDEYGEDSDSLLGFWAPNGDGKHTIHVLSLDYSGYYLGELCEEHESS